MALAETGYRHVVLDEAGIARIAGTTTKAVELVLDHLAYAWSAEELHIAYPYLSLGQIHPALAFSWDHKDELDADIARRQELVAELRRTTLISPLVARLRV